jgi:hypothetical protein
MNDPSPSENPINQVRKSFSGIVLDLLKYSLYLNLNKVKSKVSLVLTKVLKSFYSCRERLYM